MPTDVGWRAIDDVPGSHPEPPEDFHERLPSITGSVGSWFRLHSVRFDPIHFGRDPAKSGRFGAPEGQYGVLYASEDEHGAFIETFGQDTGVRVIDETDLLARGLARIESSRPVRLVDLTGEGLARIGADARLLATDHTVSRRWSAALRDHHAKPDGIRYPRRHDPSRVSVALYDQMGNTVSASPLGTMLSRGNEVLLSQILRAYDFGLVGRLSCT